LNISRISYHLVSLAEGRVLTSMQVPGTTEKSYFLP